MQRIIKKIEDNWVNLFFTLMAGVVLVGILNDWGVGFTIRAMFFSYVAFGVLGATFVISFEVIKLLFEKFNLKSKFFLYFATALFAFVIFPILLTLIFSCFGIFWQNDYCRI